MTSSIFIRSYAKDVGWLSYCLRSLRRFAHGFREIVVCIPEHDRQAFNGFDWSGVNLHWVQDLPINPYISQQRTKMLADQYCAGDMIAFVDSDCFAHRPFHACDFIADNEKPILLIRTWESLDDNARRWRNVVHGIVGFSPAFDVMASLPIMHDRRILTALREHLEHTHGKSFDEYFRTLQECCEFTSAGSFAHRFFPHFYDWRIANPESDGYPRPLLQKWSYAEAGVTPHIEEYERMLAAV